MKINRIAMYFGITGLTALTTLTAMGMGTMNVFADDAKLPAYVMDGTNAERAVSDYFVNKTEAVNENSVIIPHMDIISSAAKDNGRTVDMYGAFKVAEYVQDGRSLKEDGTAYESHGHFTLTKNDDGTYTVAGYNEIPDDAKKEAFVDVFGAGLADEAFEIYCMDTGSDLWKTIFAEDTAYYAFDNKLGLDKIEARDGSEIALANVDFSTKDARTMYAQTGANVRSAGTKKATAFDGIARGEDIKVTGMANGWARVEMNGRTGYIAENLLGDRKSAKEEKKAEKKEDRKSGKKEENKDCEHNDIERTGYICGSIESYNGKTITVNGIKAFITDDTAISGTITVGDDAKLDYVVCCDGTYNATSITDNGILPEGVARVADGRVVDTRPITTTEVCREDMGADQNPVTEYENDSQEMTSEEETSVSEPADQDNISEQAGNEGSVIDEVTEIE